jgi:hypothetical protein
MSMQTVVKFHNRQAPPGERPGGHPIVTSTMGKKGLVDMRWRPSASKTLPADGEFWRVEILRETRAGQNRGAFILRPIRKVELASIRHLIPGMFETVVRGGGAVLVVTPSAGRGKLPAQAVEYILPLEYKRTLYTKEGYSAVVVNLGGVYWDPEG